MMITTRTTLLARLSAILLLTLLSSLSAFAQPYGGVTRLSTYQTSVTCVAVTGAGNYLYAALRNDGIAVVDISDSLHPVERAHLDTPGSAIALALQGNTLFVADSTGGVRIIDVTNPITPHEIGSYQTTSPVVSVSPWNGYFALVTQSGELQFVSVTNPAQPTLVSTLTTPGTATQIAVSGNYAYVTTPSDSNRMLIINISNPAVPTIAGRCHSDVFFGFYHQVVVQGSYAYLVDLQGIFHIVDISQPATPRLVGEYFEPGGMGTNRFFFSIAGSRAYLLQEVNMAWGGLGSYFSSTTQQCTTLDISSPAQPQVLHVRQYAYQYYRSTPFHPPEMGGRTYGNVCGNCIIGNRIVSAFGDHGVLINDTSVTSTRQLAMLYSPNNRITVDSNRMFVANASTLQAVSITNPAQPTRLSRINANITSRRMVINQNRLFTAQTGVGLQVYNVANADSITPLAVYPTTESIRDFVLNGRNLYYLSTNTSAPNTTIIRVLDIFNLSNIQPVCSLSIASSPTSMEVHGDNLYLTNSSLGVRRIDISNPTNLIDRGRFGANTNHLAISGNNLYGLAGSMLTAYALPDTSVIAVLSLPFSASVVTKTSQGNFLVVGYDTGGFCTVNITNPYAPYISGGLDLRNYFLAIATVGNLAFVANDASINIYDCSQALAVVDRIDNTLPQNSSLSQNYPNPFNATTTLRYTIAQADHIEMTLFDITGREVATLFNARQEPGEYTVKLDGSTLSAGTYFIRLRSNAFTQTRKIVLLK